MKSQRRRVAPVTHKGNSYQGIASSLTRIDYDKLDEICQNLKITKSEFIRKTLEQELAKVR